MPTIAHVAEHIIGSRPLMQEAMIEGIVSFGALAEKLKPEIEKELGKEVKHSAVVMAVRRYGERIDKFSRKKNISQKQEIIMKTSLCDIGIVRSPSLHSKLKKIYSMVDAEKGETFNIVQGNYEISLIVDEKMLGRIKESLSGEKIIRTEKNCVMISLNFSKEYFSQHGVLSAVTRKLAWSGVNILEIVSTFKELSFLVSRRDAMKAYNAMERM
ncbi:MAG: ACT domain-containing protein [Candidatus Woesearchaeota archaeon]